MKRGVVLAVLVSVLIVVLAATSVMAAPVLGVHIEVPTGISGGSSDRFTASGPAVCGGLLYATGDVYTLNPTRIRTLGEDRFWILSMVKHFVCDDGSGTFDVELVVKLDLLTRYTKARWTVMGGTGSYAGLTGGGQLRGTPIVLGISILDVYDGRLR